ncbi:conserved hypothetical protein [Agrobacterium sp. NCPPB 925]|nr:conserved hypothetical protein [Agrobacterium sp. NCPPB 925]
MPGGPNREVNKVVFFHNSQVVSLAFTAPVN